MKTAFDLDTNAALASLLTPRGRNVPRPITPDWEIGDVWTDPDTRTRWIIRNILRVQDHVELEAVSSTAAQSRHWTTRLSRLGVKPVRTGAAR